MAEGYRGFLKTEMHLNSDLFLGLSQREGANCPEEGTDTWLDPPSSLQSFASSKEEKDGDGRGREEGEEGGEQGTGKRKGKLGNGMGGKPAVNAASGPAG